MSGRSAVSGTGASMPAVRKPCGLNQQIAVQQIACKTTIIFSTFACSNIQYATKKECQNIRKGFRRKKLKSKFRLSNWQRLWFVRCKGSNLYRKPLPIFEILNLESNSSKSLFEMFAHSSSVAYCIFEHRRKDYCCFTSHLLHSNLLVQSTRFPNCWHARTGPWHCRPTGHMHPRTRLSASGKFLAATVLCSSDTDPADQICRAEQDTTGS